MRLLDIAAETTELLSEINPAAKSRLVELGAEYAQIVKVQHGQLHLFAGWFSSDSSCAGLLSFLFVPFCGSVFVSAVLSIWMSTSHVATFLVALQLPDRRVCLWLWLWFVPKRWGVGFGRRLAAKPKLTSGPCTSEVLPPLCAVPCVVGVVGSEGPATASTSTRLSIRNANS